MLTETVSVGGQHSSCFIEGEPLLPAFRHELGTEKIICVVFRIISYIKSLCLLRCNICNLGPLSLLGMCLYLFLSFPSGFCFILIYRLLFLVCDLRVQDWGHPQSESRSWHQICYYALMGLASINLSKLLLVVNLYPDAVFKNVLYVLLFSDELTVFFTVHDFLEVLGVAPSHLDGS